MSDAVGNALIQIEPDFSQFERGLTRSLETAIKKIESSTANDLRVDLKVDENIAKVTKEVTKGFSGIEKSTASVESGFAGTEDTLGRLEGTLGSLSASVAENAKQLRLLNNSIKKSTEQAAQSQGAFSRLVQTLSQLAITANAAIQIGQLITKFKDASVGADSFFNKIKAGGAALLDTGRNINAFNNQIITTGRAANTVKNSVDGLTKTVVRGNQTQTKSGLLVVENQKRQTSALRAQIDAQTAVNNSQKRAQTEVLKAAASQTKLRAETLAANAALSNTSKLTNTLGAGFKKSQAGITDAAKGLGNVQAAVSSAGAAIGAGVADKLEDVFQAVSRGTGTATSNLGRLTQSATAAGRSIVSGIGQAGTRAFGGLTDSLKRVQTSAAATGRSLTSAIGSGISGGLNATSGALNGLVSNLTKTKTAADATGRSISAAFTGTAAKAASGLSSSLSGLANIFNRNNTAARNSATGIAATNTALAATTTAARNAARELSLNDKIIKTLDDGLRGFAGGVGAAGTSLERLNLAGKIVRKVLTGIFVDGIKSVDDLVLGLARANKALGGLIGLPSFGLALGSTIGLVTTLTGVVTAGAAAIVAFAQKASNAGEAINALNVLLGQSTTDTFKDLIGDTTQLGISASKLNSVISPIIPLLKNAGLAGDDLANQLNNVVRRAIDLSSIFNVDVTQSIQAIGAGIRGEIEPIERLGVAFNAAEVESKAMALGFEKVDGQLSESSKQFSRLQLILEKSADAEGDFANTSTSVANAQRVLGATIDTISGQISSAFLPAATKLLQVFIKFAQDNGPKFTAFFTAAEPLITQFAGTVAQLASIATEVGGIFSAFLLPAFQALTTILKIATPILSAFLVKFLVIRTITTILQAFTVVLAFLPAQIQGAAIATGVLSQNVGNLLRPLGLVILAMQVFGVNIESTSGALLGGFGGALKFIEPLLRIILIRMLALKSIPAIIGAINVAIGQLPRSLGVATLQVEKTSAALKGLAGGGFGIALAAGIALFTREVKSATTSVEELKKTTEEGLFSKIVDDAELSGLDKVTTALKSAFSPSNFQIGSGISGIIEDIQNAFNAKEFERIQNNLAALFEVSPARAREFVARVEATGRDTGGRLRTILKQFERDAKIASENIDPFEKAKQTLEEIQKSFDGLLKENNALISAQGGLNSARDKLLSIDEQIAAKNAEIAELRQKEAEGSGEDVQFRERILDIDNQLRDLAQEREQLAFDEQRRREEFEPKLEEFEDRATLANIALARAKRDAEKAQLAINEAVKEGIKQEDIYIDVTGLTLDQIRGRLSNIRAALSAQRALNKNEKDSTKEGQTKEELQENALEAQIAVRDAEREVAEIQTNRSDFIRENAIAQREYNEKVADLVVQEAGLRRDRAEAARELQRALNGELGTKKEIGDKTREIRDLEKQRSTAVKEIAVAEAELNLALAQAFGVESAILEAEKQLSIAKFNQLTNTQQISEAFRDQISLIDQQIAKFGELNQAPAAFLDTILAANNQIGNLAQTAQNAGLNGDLFNSLAPGVNVPAGTNIGGTLAAAAQLLSTAADGLTKQERLIQELSGRAGFGLFPTGFAEGGIHTGTPGPMGTIVRVGEHGRPEATLPLTKPDRFNTLLQQALPYAHPIVKNMITMMLDGPTSQRQLMSNPAQIIQSSVTPTISFIPGPSLSSARIGSVAVRQAPVSKKPTPLEQKLDRLITLQEEANQRPTEVNAPITVSNPDSNYTAQKIARELKKRMDRI